MVRHVYPADTELSASLKEFLTNLSIGLVWIPRSWLSHLVGLLLGSFILSFSIFSSDKCISPVGHLYADDSKINVSHPALPSKFRIQILTGHFHLNIIQELIGQTRSLSVVFTVQSLLHFMDEFHKLLSLSFLIILKFFPFSLLKPWFGK